MPQRDKNEIAFSNFAHDFKSPLAALTGSLEVLALMHERLNSEKRGDLISSALSESRKIEQYIAKVTEYIRLEEDLIEPQIKSLKLNDIIEFSIQRAKVLSKQAIIELKASNENIIIETDENILGRIVDIILENSILHNSEVPQIKINISQDEIEIIDNINGIEVETRELIFNKFTKFTIQNKRNLGLGIGLYIAQKYAKKLGFAIFAQYPSTVRITFN